MTKYTLKKGPSNTSITEVEKMSYTKGKWGWSLAVDSEGTNKLITPPDVFVEFDGKSYAVCELNARNFSVHEAEANARRIAHCHNTYDDLLEACKGLLLYLRREGLRFDGMIDAEQAIAKAESEE